ncbi:helix-turn-helix domain-containing protein [Gelidibacter mesophilus]|uniref:helix-turn-helix domain-containing protein n=1 Tax=Gelidibacter mesophilus TaxID=169050 RepID=UPI0004040BB3|nr:helix-turn-helix transcriptional regulator [Gelidibacter mesophilus]
MNNQLQIITEKNLLNHIGLGKSYPSTKTSIFVVKKGRITFVKAFETVTLKENNIYFSFPNGFFELIAISPDIEINIIALDVELFSKLSFEFNRLDVYQFLLSNYSNQFEIPETIVSELWKLSEVLQLNLIKSKSKFNTTILLNLLSVVVYTALDAINTYHDFTTKGVMSRKQELAFGFLTLLSKHYKKEREVSFYAQKLMVTTRHLSKTIKDITNKTANQIIHQYIIAESKVLLTSSNKLISEIAFELNFNDPYYFSNFFKKHTGLNPTEFKAKNKKDYIYTSI